MRSSLTAALYSLSASRPLPPELAGVDLTRLPPDMLLQFVRAAMSVPREQGMNRLLELPKDLPAWLGQDDLDCCVAELERSGLEGPLSYYKSADLDWERLGPFQGKPVAVPALFIGGDRDIVTIWSQEAISRAQSSFPIVATGSSRNSRGQSTKRCLTSSSLSRQTVLRGEFRNERQQYRTVAARVTFPNRVHAAAASRRPADPGRGVFRTGPTCINSLPSGTAHQRWSVSPPRNKASAAIAFVVRTTGRLRPAEEEFRSFVAKWVNAGRISRQARGAALCSTHPAAHERRQGRQESIAPGPQTLRVIMPAHKSLRSTVLKVGPPRRSRVRVRAEWCSDTPFGGACSAH
jgi:hypothetical protein